MFFRGDIAMSEAAGRGLVQGLKEADDQARLWQGSGRASSLDQAVLSGNSSSSSHSTLASLSPSEGLSPSGSGQSDADMDEFSRQRQRTRSDGTAPGCFFFGGSFPFIPNQTMAKEVYINLDEASTTSTCYRFRSRRCFKPLFARSVESGATTCAG